MICYPFECRKCGFYTERFWTVHEYTDLVKCEKCNSLMNRVYTAPLISVPNLEGFNAGLGVPQRRVKDVLREHRDNGHELVEVGNERVKPRPQGDRYALTDKDMAYLNRIDDSKTVKE